MRLLACITLLISSISLACEVSLPHRIVVMGEGGADSVIEMTECTENLKIDLRQIINEVEGRISSRQLSGLLIQKGHTDLTIEPAQINVIQLATLIRDQLQLPPGVQVKSTKAENTAPFLSIAPGDQVEIQCIGCLFGPHQPVNIIINGFDGSTRSFPARADFKKMVRAFRAISDIPSFSTIESRAQLREEYIESIPHTDLITDLESLKFYKTNKPIRTGSFLKQSDLNALNLVKAGLRTEVLLENQMIKIKTQGISRSNGSLGEIVEVFHPQKNKKYQGKVIDVNKVLVEL